MGFVEDPEKALRAAKLRIRFADAIVKAKYGKILDGSANKGDVVKKIEREKQLLRRRQLKEKARIEAEIKAPVLKLRHNFFLEIKKMEEEANSRMLLGHHLEAEKEFVKLCGGSHLARRRWVEVFGLFLRRDEEIEEEECYDLEEGEIV